MNSTNSEEISKNVQKTGTVTLGLVCKDGIVVAADRRVSLGSGNGVAYLAGALKKVIQLNDQIVATVAGTASDAMKTLQLAKAEIALRELRLGSPLTVPEAANLLTNMAYQGIRTPSMIPNIAHFVLAGFDESGLHLFDVSPDGLLKEIEENYVATGSGMMQAHPILDSEYKKGLSVQEGVDLAIKCIRAASGRDPSVGEGIDIYVVKKDKVEQVSKQRFSKELIEE